MKKATKSNSEAHPVHLSTTVISFYNQISPKKPSQVMSLRFSPHSRLGTLQDPLCHWYRYPLHVPGQWIPWGCTFQGNQTWSQGATLILSCTKILVPHTSWISGNIVCSDVQMIYIAFSSIFTCTVHYVHSANKSHVTTKHCKKHNRVSKFESKHLQNISNPSCKPRILVMRQVWLFFSDPRCKVIKSRIRKSCASGTHTIRSARAVLDVFFAMFAMLKNVQR